MPASWPEGSLVVIMDGAPRQVALPPSARGQERFWRIGPALRAPDDASYRLLTTEVKGVGLRPYAPCHMRAEGRQLSWVRRTRVDGDSWDGTDVPLGESLESYRLRITKDDIVIHQIDLDRPEYLIPEAVFSEAAQNGGFTVAVAQLSDLFGAGPYLRRTFDGDQ
jgi:hypothetical protein